MKNELLNIPLALFESNKFIYNNKHIEIRLVLYIKIKIEELNT